jgi:hypothetical protein
MEWLGGFPCWYARGTDERLCAAILALPDQRLPYAFRAFVGEECCGTFETIWAAKAQIESVIGLQLRRA